MDDERKIDTGGGAATEGDVNAESFTGRDHIAQNVNVYTTPEKRPPGQRSRKSSGSMAATVEEKIRDRLNEHDVKLVRLEIGDETIKANLTDYVRELRQDIVDMKAELNPLRGQGILAHPSPMADKEVVERTKQQNKLVVRLLTIITIAFGVGVLLFIGFLVWLALTRV